MELCNHTVRGFWLSKFPSTNQCFPWQFKAGARILDQHQLSFAGQREEASEAATTQKALFLKHCQQTPRKGIETKSSLS